MAEAPHAHAGRACTLPPGGGRRRSPTSSRSWRPGPGLARSAYLPMSRDDLLAFLRRGGAVGRGRSPPGRRTTAPRASARPSWTPISSPPEALPATVEALGGRLPRSSSRCGGPAGGRGAVLCWRPSPAGNAARLSPDPGRAGDDAPGAASRRRSAPPRPASTRSRQRQAIGIGIADLKRGSSTRNQPRRCWPRSRSSAGCAWRDFVYPDDAADTWRIRGSSPGSGTTLDREAPMAPDGTSSDRTDRRSSATRYWRRSSPSRWSRTSPTAGSCSRLSHQATHRSAHRAAQPHASSRYGWPPPARRARIKATSTSTGSRR
ncbi:hypothetical protein HBB16_15525 [Pseudonocardia sp. MCCB 268]|nr:hypothetical protein [Pseudonocardia cytotoxica]